MMRLAPVWGSMALCAGLTAQAGVVSGWTPESERALLDQIAGNELAKGIYGDVFERLKGAGVPPSFLSQAFSHPEIAIDEEVVRRFERPAEKMPYDRYRKIFITEERIAGGVRFLKEKRALLDSVASQYGVDPYLLGSIAGVESRYGVNAETHPVFVALHTVIHRLPRREKWVEREMAEFLSYCYENNIPPLSLSGSYAGAFGYGQFIPSSFRAYAVDFDGDGIRHPFEWPDVLASMANYLVKNGYAKGSHDFSQNSPNWKSVLRYNPALNYVKVIMELRGAIVKAEG